MFNVLNPCVLSQIQGQVPRKLTDSSRHCECGLAILPIYDDKKDNASSESDILILSRLMGILVDVSSIHARAYLQEKHDKGFVGGCGGEERVLIHTHIQHAYAVSPVKSKISTLSSTVR